MGGNIPGDNFLGGNFPGEGGNFPGRSLMGGNFPYGNFPGGNFPRTKKYNLHGCITRAFTELRMRSFQGIVFIRIRTNKEIFKSALVYL